MWNENRKAVLKSKNYLIEILKDLEADTTIINRSKGFANNIVKAEKWALQKLDYTVKDVDSLWYNLNGFYVGIPLKDITYQNIQNSGDSKFSGFDSLYDEIANYYTKVYERSHSYYEWDKIVTLEGQMYLQELNERLEMSNYRMEFLASESSLEAFQIIQDSTEQKKILIEFAKSPLGRNHFKSNYIRHKRGINRFNETKEETINLLSEIKLVLSK